VVAAAGFSSEENLDVRWTHGLVIVATSWIACMFLGAIPLVLSGHWTSYLDACFEAMSALATTQERAVFAVPLLLLPQILFSELAIPPTLYSDVVATVEKAIAAIADDMVNYPMLDQVGGWNIKLYPGNYSSAAGWTLDIDLDGNPLMVLPVYDDYASRPTLSSETGAIFTVNMSDVFEGHARRQHPEQIVCMAERRI